MKIDKEKLKEVVEKHKPLDICKDIGCSDECVSISGNTIWWKCRICGKVTKFESGPITI